jgi:hypothetical protein
MPDAPAILTGAPATPPNNSPAPAPAQQAAPAPAAAPAMAKVTPGSKAWAEMTAEQRHAQLRGPENPRARGYSPAIEQREAAAARAAGEAPAGDDPQAPPAAGEKVKIGKYEVSEEEVGDLMADKAARDLARTQIPADPKAYKLDLPEGVALPGGAKVEFGKDPDSVAAADAARAWAHKQGLSQQQFSELLSIQAHSVAAQEMRIATYARAEVDKLGANGPQRIDGLSRWIIGEMGNEKARPIIASMATAAHVEFYEKLLSKQTSQGAASFSQQHRVAPDDKSIPGFEKMSFAEKRFAQDQRAARRR